MTVQVVFPKIGFAMDEGQLAQWLVNHGDAVREGQPLYRLESDKSIQEIEAPASGVITLFARAGETFKAGDVLAEIAPPQR